MRFILTSLIILPLNIVYVKANLLRNKGVKDAEEHRTLNWEMLVPGYTNVTNDLWYSDYDRQEIPLNGSSYWEDKPDKFRTGDLCFKDGTYNRSNCPTELDCSHLNNNAIGPAKLCINRVPTPTGMWYVLLQKCVPSWENCDKCLCGTMTSSGSTGVCVYNPECDSDDDRIKIDCSNPSQVTVLGDYTFNSGTGSGYIGVGSLHLEPTDAQNFVLEKVDAAPTDANGASKGSKGGESAATQDAGASKGGKGETSVTQDAGTSKGGGETAATEDAGASKGADGAVKGRRRRAQNKLQ